MIEQMTMIEQLTVTFEAVGVIRWPLLFSLGAVLGLSVVSGARLTSVASEASLRTKTWIDGILFWGGFAMICGVLGSLVGIIIAAQSIEAAGAISTTLIAGGLKLALLSSSFGVLILAFAALSWYTLQLRWRLIGATEQEIAA